MAVNKVPGRYYVGRKMRSRIYKTIIFVVLIVLSVTILAPAWWMVATSFKSMKEIMTTSNTFWPKHFHWHNYVAAWEAAPFTRYTLNTAFITLFVVLGTVISNSFVAYGFAKIKFPGRDWLFSILLGTMMIPGFVTMIPTYVIFTKIHWVGTYLPLIVPSFFSGAFFTFMLRQFYRQIPNELLEAAKIDGAGHLYIWWKIMLPLVRPALATVAIFTFNGAWNDFLGPLLYVSNESQYTLQIGLTTFQGQVATQWNYLMAASVVALLPVVLLFFLFQRYFIEGSNIMGGIKG
ncbi:carbohydrate ABC transporter permease [Alicyclobacillus curvatus]|jgi:multiple sugar transport system permease protein|nr:carbohydrate ABC transporter permease [Alicyclobacillus curvatus]